MDDQTLDLDTLEDLTDPEQVRAVAGFLEPLEKDTEILVFVSPGCAVCPHQVRSAATVALASPRVTLEIVDASQDPELAAHYEIGGVPTTVVDDELVMAGVVGSVELALRLVERQGPEQAGRVFNWLVGNGHHTPAVERLADGRGTAAFMELWAQGDAKQRMALLPLAEESLLYDPYGLNEMVPALIEDLDGTAAPARDHDRREPTADLLGHIGHPDARPALERHTDDPNLGVAQAAVEALAELDEA